MLFPDHFDHDWRAGSRDRVYHAVAELEAGVTEIHVQPVIDTPEVRAISEHAEGWIDDYALVTDDERLHQAAGRQRGDPHRLPRPQGRDAASRLSAAPASPLRSRSSSGPVGPVLFSLPRM